MFRSRILILVNCPSSRTKMAVIWKIRFVVVAYIKANSVYTVRAQAKPKLDQSIRRQQSLNFAESIGQV